MAGDATFNNLTVNNGVFNSGMSTTGTHVVTGTATVNNLNVSGTASYTNLSLPGTLGVAGASTLGDVSASGTILGNPGITQNPRSILQTRGPFSVDHFEIGTSVTVPWLNNIYRNQTPTTYDLDVKLCMFVPNGVRDPRELHQLYDMSKTDIKSTVFNAWDTIGYLSSWGGAVIDTFSGYGLNKAMEQAFNPDAYAFLTDPSKTITDMQNSGFFDEMSNALCNFKKYESSGTNGYIDASGVYQNGGWTSEWDGSELPTTYMDNNKLPLIIFAPDAGNQIHIGLEVLQELASQGFIVVYPQSESSAIFYRHFTDRAATNTKSAEDLGLMGLNYYYSPLRNNQWGFDLENKTVNWYDDVIVQLRVIKSALTSIPALANKINFDRTVVIGEQYSASWPSVVQKIDNSTGVLSHTSEYSRSSLQNIPGLTDVDGNYSVDLFKVVGTYMNHPFVIGTLPSSTKYTGYGITAVKYDNYWPHNNIIDDDLTRTFLFPSGFKFPFYIREGRDRVIYTDYTSTINNMNLMDVTQYALSKTGSTTKTESFLEQNRVGQDFQFPNNDPSTAYVGDVGSFFITSPPGTEPVVYPENKVNDDVLFGGKEEELDNVGRLANMELITTTSLACRYWAFNTRSTDALSGDNKKKLITMEHLTTLPRICSSIYFAPVINGGRYHDTLFIGNGSISAGGNLEQDIELKTDGIIELSGQNGSSTAFKVHGTANVIGNTTLSNVSVSGDSSFSNVSVSGDSSFSNVSVSGPLDVTGDSSFSNVSVSGDSSFSNVSVSGDSSFSNVSASGTLIVNGSASSNVALVGGANPLLKFGDSSNVLSSNAMAALYSLILAADPSFTP